MIEIIWLDHLNFKKSESHASEYRRCIERSCDIVVRMDGMPYCYLERGGIRISLEKQPSSYERFEDIATIPMIGLFCEEMSIDKYVELLCRFNIQCKVSTL